MPDLSEKSYLTELIRDFGTGKAIDPEEALRQIQSTYRTMEFKTDSYTTYLFKNKESLRVAFKVWIKIFHKFLFYNILNNAGEFRKSTDKNGGIVLFGRDVHRKPFGSQFKGTHPDLIEAEIENIVKLLSADDHQPVYTAIEFLSKIRENTSIL